MDFAGRHVVITGGTGVLGVAVVGALLEAGARCHVPCTNDGKAHQFPHRSHPGLTLATTGSLTEEAAVASLYDGIPELWASIHLAGGFGFGSVADTDKAALTRQIDMNFVTCFLCCRGAVRAMKGNGGGRIVNVASRPGIEWRGGAKTASYAATKAAVAALTVALAEDVAKDGILVNAVVPSILDTPTNRKDMPKADHSAWPKVEEVAQTILFLASPENRVTRGALVPVYGKT